MTAKKQKPDTHRLGKNTGYDLRDGKYFLAPIHQESFQRTVDERRALELLLQMVTNHVAERLAVVTAAQTKWWKVVEGDLGVVFRGNGYQYNAAEGFIEPIPKPKSEEKP